MSADDKTTQERADALEKFIQNPNPEYLKYLEEERKSRDRQIKVEIYGLLGIVVSWVLMVVILAWMGKM